MKMTLPGGPTKEEIMAVSLAKLSLRRDDVFVDIGCGTGAVSVQAAPQVMQVYAVDLREEAVSCTRDAAREHGIANIDVRLGHGADLLEKLPRADALFIGGSRDLGKILSLAADKRVRSIVVNAVLLRTLHDAVTTMQELGIFTEVVQVMIARSYPLASGLMFRPLDPVWIIVGGSPC
jgi:cobalt-precorrin-6B (C15)-methyltransferase